MTVTATLQSRPLFGGAITMGLPADYIDSSDLRQIPDNQEVWLSSDSDTSVIVELLAPVTEGDAENNLWDAAKFHFDSVAHDNSSLSTNIITAAPAAPIAPQHQAIPPADKLITPTPVTLVGTQRIHKFSYDPTGAPRPGHESDVPDDVWIALALFRVDATVQGKKKRADVVVTVNVRASAENGAAEVEKTQKWLEDSIRGFKIVDFGLFADE